MLTTDFFTQPVTVSQPCGENLEYEPEFTALETLKAGRGEQQFGKTIVEAEGPDWSQVYKQALTLAHSTKDLRVYVTLAQGALVTKGVAAYGAVLQGMIAACDAYWDEIHPNEDWQDDQDATFRINSLQALLNAAWLKTVRSIKLFESAFFGAVTWRKLAILTQQLESKSDDDKVDEAAIQSAFQEFGIEQIEALHQGFQSVLQGYQQLKRFLDLRVGIENSVSVQLMQKEWQAIAHYIEQQYTQLKGPDMLMADAEASVENTAQDAGEIPMATTQATQAISGVVSSRADVLKTLQQVCDYYRKYEPSSPIPLLLERAIRLVPMSFAEILQEMCSEGIPQVEKLAGVPLVEKK